MKSNLIEQVRPALVMLLLMTLITGLLYPAAMTGLGQVLFPAQANGSLLTKDGKVVGSALIGQQFDDPKYFWGRLSATTPAYNGASSSGSNLGPSSEALLDMVRARVDVLIQADPQAARPVPVDLLTASASGLDPHISPAAAEYQVRRVARARDMSEANLRRLVDRYTEGRTLGLFGEPRVNVLMLNLAMDAGE